MMVRVYRWAFCNRTLFVSLFHNTVRPWRHCAIPELLLYNVQSFLLVLALAERRIIMISWFLFRFATYRWCRGSPLSRNDWASQIHPIGKIKDLWCRRRSKQCRSSYPGRRRWHRQRTKVERDKRRERKEIFNNAQVLFNDLLFYYSDKILKFRHATGSINNTYQTLTTLDTKLENNTVLVITCSSSG